MEILSYVALAVLILVLLRALAGKESPRRRYPYRKADALFTSAERSFLGVLEQAVGQRYRVMGKVRLADIISAQEGRAPDPARRAFYKIACKHVDFVLCDPRTLDVAGVIELDDKTHKEPERRQRDTFVDEALGEAGVPILHVPVQRSYDIAELRRQVKEAFASK